MDATFYKAVCQAVHYLLHQRFRDVMTGELTDPCLKHKTALQVLDYSIGDGGGHTLYPTVGDYWFVHYRKGITLSLLAGTDNDGVIREVPVERKLVLQIAEALVSEFNSNTVQLSLF